MKKLYSVLAMLMFICFVLITGSLVLNKAIDKSVKVANENIDRLTKQYNDSLTDGRLSHNLYFINCFPNACGKFSFAKFRQDIKIIDPVTNVETVNKEKIEIGAVDFIVAKYNPLLGKLFIDAKPNNVIINKNGKKYASAYYESIKYETSASLVSFYEIFKKDAGAEALLDQLSWESAIEVTNIKAAIEDLRVKADKITFDSSSYNITDTTVSSVFAVGIEALSIDNSDEKLDMAYSLKLENFSKEAVLAGLKFSQNLVKEKSLNEEDKQELAEKAIQEAGDYISELIDAIRAFDKNKTSIKLVDSYLTEYEVKDGKKDITLDLNINADLTLDEKLNPKGFIKLDIVTSDKDSQKELDSEQVKKPSSEKSIKVFKKQSAENYTFDLVAEGGNININEEHDINIDGLVKSGLDLVSGLVSMISLKAVVAQ